jgi:hypothetical protein
MGNVDFSPEVDLAKKQRWLWQQVVKHLEGKRVSSFLIKRKAQQCSIVGPFSVTLAQAQDHFRAADSAYNALKQHAPILHNEFLCNSAANKSGKVSLNGQQAARRMLQQERQKS